VCDIVNLPENLDVFRYLVVPIPPGAFQVGCTQQMSIPNLGNFVGEPIRSTVLEGFLVG
jgi:hypothetical protein